MACGLSNGHVTNSTMMYLHVFQFGLQNLSIVIDMVGISFRPRGTHIEMPTIIF